MWNKSLETMKPWCREIVSKKAINFFVYRISQKSELYYQDLLQEERPQFATTCTERTNDISLQENDEITTEEVKKLVASMKNGKSSGANGIQIELTKHNLKPLFHLLAYIFSSVLRGKDVTEIRTTTDMSNIYKKDDRQDCSYCRAIVSSTSYPKYMVKQ